MPGLLHLRFLQDVQLISGRKLPNNQGTLQNKTWNNALPNGLFMFIQPLSLMLPADNKKANVNKGLP